MCPVHLKASGLEAETLARRRFEATPFIATGPSKRSKSAMKLDDDVSMATTEIEKGVPAETGAPVNKHREAGNSANKAVFNEIMETADQVILNVGGCIPDDDDKHEMYENIENEVCKRLGGDSTALHLVRAYMRGYWFHSIGIHREESSSVYDSPERE